MNIKVPEGMLKAVRDAEYGNPHFEDEDRLEAALRWLSENPIVPTNEFCEEMAALRHPSLTETTFKQRFVAEWLRRMFLAPDVSRVLDLRERMLGRIFTQTEADCLIEQIRLNTRGEK